MSWLQRLKQGLQRSSNQLTQGITQIFNRRKLDAAALEELEELLIASDMSVSIAEEVTEKLRKTRFGQEVAPEEVRGALAEEVANLLYPVAKPLKIDPAKKPHVVLVVGVNGSGKTTTIAKLAQQWREEGRSVVLAAGDTFRAAAVEQLKIWGARTGCPVVSRPEGSDAAGLAYDALVEARTQGAEILLIDTAGRLQNKAGLMAELQKIIRVMKKVDASAPHTVLLVLDATVGQNGLEQAREFTSVAGVTGIVLTKLDGTAKGGVAVSIAHDLKLPIRYVGVGEGIDDLIPFSPQDYVDALFQDKW
jgi:fused signal recognition particle receptor